MNSVNVSDNEIRSRFGILVDKTARAMMKSIHHALNGKGYDVTPEQFVILVALWEKNGQSQRELADILEKDKTTLTRVLDNMEKRGLVIRCHDDADRRIRKITLTAKGKDFEKKLMGLVMDGILKATGGITGEDLHACNLVLEKICDTILKSG